MMLSLWRALLGIEKSVIEDIEFDDDGRRGGGACAAGARSGVGAVGAGGGVGWLRLRSWTATVASP